MKNLLKHLLWVVFLFFTASSFAQQHRMHFVELHGEFLGNLKVEYAGNSTNINQYGFGLEYYYGKESLGILSEYNYRKINLKNLKVPEIKSVSISEFYVGVRYYPMRPTMMLGKMAIRLTAGAMGGLDLEPNWRLLFFFGLTFSPITSASGLSLNFVYRPGTLPAGGYPLEPSWMIRLGLILGPSLK
jgi:hypothetical protein